MPHYKMLRHGDVTLSPTGSYKLLPFSSSCGSLFGLASQSSSSRCGSAASLGSNVVLHSSSSTSKLVPNDHISSSPESFAGARTPSPAKSSKQSKTNRKTSAIEKALFSSAATFMAPSCDSLLNRTASTSSHSSWSSDTPVLVQSQPINTTRSNPIAIPGSLSAVSPSSPTTTSPERSYRRPKLERGTSALEKALISSATTFMAPSCHEGLLNPTNFMMPSPCSPDSSLSDLHRTQAEVSNSSCKTSVLTTPTSPQNPNKQKKALRGTSVIEKALYSSAALFMGECQDSSEGQHSSKHSSESSVLLSTSTHITSPTLPNIPRCRSHDSVSTEDYGISLSPKNSSKFTMVPEWTPTSSLRSDPIGMLAAVRDRLRFSLINTVGLTRANNLYSKHVMQAHFLIIHAGEIADEAMAKRIRCLIEDRPRPFRVKGRWNIPLGAKILDKWQQLVESATTILVIMSRALCQDKVLTLCFPDVLIKDQRVVPLFLEPFTDAEVDAEIPSQLRTIVHIHGKALYTESCNIEDYIENLLSSFDYKRHYGWEIISLESLLQNYWKDPDYVCPCGSC